MSAHVYRRPYDYALNLRLQARKRLGVGGRNIVEAAGSVSIALSLLGDGSALLSADGAVSSAVTIAGDGASIANADGTSLWTTTTSGGGVAGALADGSTSLAFGLVAEGEGLVFEQLHSRFGADDGAEGANTQLAAEDVDVSLGKEATVRLRQQLDLTGHLTALSGRLYFKRVGDPDTEWEALATHDPFGASKYGIREFDYILTDEYLTTHTPDVKRITANTGITGATLNGLPSNLEPRLVTQDSVPAALGQQEAVNQSLLASNAASNYRFMHNGAIYSVYMLIRTPVASNDEHIIDTELFTTVSAGIRIRRRSSTLGGAVGIVLKDDANNALISDQVGVSDCPDNTNMFVGIHCDGTRFHCSVNGVIKESWTPSGAFGTGDPGQTLRIGNSSGASSHGFMGHIYRISCYRNVDHTSGDVLAQFYALVKSTYPTLSLP